MKKILSFCAVLLMACSVNAQAQTNAQQNASDAKAGQAQLLPWETPRDTTCHEVLLETTLGNIRVALYNDTPHHRDNFLKLVNSGYYNGCIFQRVIKNFMIQGGDYSCRKVTPGKVEKFDVNYTVPPKSSILSTTTSVDSSVRLARETMRTQPRLRLLPISISPGAETSRLDR